MTLSLLTAGLAAGSGTLVGIVLGLVGAGGSIIATPLLVYVVGVQNPHEAIGTGAVAVAAAALAGLAQRARGGQIKWRCAALFASAGVIGALVGARLGQSFDGARLLSLFGALMIVVGAAMFARRRRGGDADVRLNWSNAALLAPRLALTGGAVGLLSGFFGIGGGFLIVPGLMTAIGLPIEAAIATSLVAVASFGATTAASYAAVGLVNWPVAAAFVVGGVAGGVPGAVLGRVLASRKQALAGVLGGLIVAVGCYVVVRGLPA